jgi:hypothetical protein
MGTPVIPNSDSCSKTTTSVKVGVDLTFRLMTQLMVQLKTRLKTQRRNFAAAVCLSACLVLALTSSGCAFFLGSKAKNPPAELSFEGDDCIKNVGNDIRRWWGGALPSASGTIDCVVQAMDQFAERTSGKNPESWSKGEFANFIDTYFPRPDADAPSAGYWIEELLKLKQAIIGGSNDRLTRVELARARALLIKLKPELDALSPHLNVALFRSEKAAPGVTKEVASVVNRLSRLLAEETLLTERARPPYEVEAFFKLAQRFGSQFDDQESWLALAESGKAVFAGGPSRYVIAHEWPGLIEAFGRAWSIALNVRYEVMQSEDLFGRDLPHVERTLNEFLELADASISAQGPRSKGVSAERLSALIEALEARSMLPASFKASTLKKLLPKILGKMLYGNSFEDKEEKSKSLDYAQVNSLRLTLRDWLAGQKEILRVYDTRDALTALTLTRELSRPRAGLDPSAESSEGRLARTQLAAFLQKGRPLVRDRETRLMIMPTEKLPAMMRRDLDFLNLLRAGIAMLFRGYSHDKRPTSLAPSLKESEVTEFYWDVRDFGKEIGLVDIRNNSAASRTVTETNLFLSVSDGDDRITHHEAIEWFNVVLSAGLLADRIYSSMERECGTSATDIFGKRKLKVDCFRRRFQNDIGSLVPNLPGLVSWYKKNPQSVAEFQVAWENASISNGYLAEVIDSSDLRGLIPVLHYVENLMAIYDANRNDVLDTEELWKAFPNMSLVIRKMAQGQAEEEWKQKAIFTWILTFRTIPTSDWIGGAKIALWSTTMKFWSGTADRMRLMEVLAAFNDLARSDRLKRLKDFIELRKKTLRNEITSGDPAVIVPLTELLACQTNASGVLAELFRVNVNVVFGSSFDSDAIAQNMKQLVAKERRLEHFCLPF